MKNLLLKEKFSLFMMIIVTVFLITGGLLFGMANYIQTQMKMLVDINNRVYDLKSTVNEVTNEYKYYSVSGKEEERMIIYETLEKLDSNSISLKEDIFKNVYLREIDDLRNMIETFLEQTKEGLYSFGSQSRKERVKSYEKISYTAQLIDKYYDYVYSAMKNYSDEEQVKLEREKAFILEICGIVIFILFIGVVAVLAWFSRGILRPLSRLAYKAATFRSEEPGQWEEGKDEIQNLTNTFDAMLLRIDEQVEQMKINMNLELELKQQRIERIKMEKLLQDSEMKALQSRINPHFMFNTLNSIAQLAYLEEAPQTERMIEAASDYFRYNLKDIHHVSTVGDEVKNIRDYIYIQKIRFEKRINFELNYDVRAEKGKIPALTLQPIIENSIIHGLGFCEENGKITIRIDRLSDCVRISICDNGKGIDGGRLEIILDYIKGTDEKGIHSDSIGLKNVVDRMRVFFGNRFEMNIVSEPDVKTMVEITIPYEENLCIKY